MAIDVDTALTDEGLAQFAWMMKGEALKVLPANRCPRSVWMQAQRIIVETAGRRWLALATIVFTAAVAISVALFFSQLPWYSAVGAAILLCWGGLRVSSYLSRLAVVKAADSCPEALIELWKVRACAFEVQGKTYDAGNGINRWQDVVCLAAGWEPQMKARPLSREEQFDAILQRLSEARKSSTALSANDN